MRGRVVGVKVEFDEVYEDVKNVKVCEMLAKVEGTATVRIEDISCPIARYVFGMNVEGLESILVKAKRVPDLETARRIVNSLERMEGVKALTFSTFEEFKADVVVYIVNPFNAFKLLRKFYTTIKPEFSCVVGACSEVIARPFKRGINVSLGCPGSRMFLRDEDLFVRIRR